MQFGSEIIGLINGEEWWQIITLAVLVISSVLVVVSTAMVRVLKAIKEVVKSVNDIRNSPPKDYRPQVFAEADVIDLLRAIKNDTHGDRISLMQFHNGEKSIANNPFLKFSATHENLSMNARSAQKYMTGLPISIFGHWIREIFESRFVQCQDIFKLCDDGDMRGAQQLLMANGTKSLYLFPLENALGKTFGFGMVEYTDKPVELNEETIQWVRDRFKATGVLLSGTTYS